MVRTTRSMSENQFGFEATSANFFDESNGDLEAYFADSNFVANPSGQSDYITTTLLTDLINTDEASLDVCGALTACSTSAKVSASPETQELALRLPTCSFAAEKSIWSTT